MLTTEERQEKEVEGTHVTFDKGLNASIGLDPRTLPVLKKILSHRLNADVTGATEELTVANDRCPIPECGDYGRE